MATMIEQYNGAKREQAQCVEWASLIGQRYSGGGGGIGELKSLKLAQNESGPTVYHQYSDGARNYHTMPAALAVHLEDAIKARFGELLADALDRQGSALQAIAAEAVREHTALLKAAGLSAPTPENR